MGVGSLSRSRVRCGNPNSGGTQREEPGYPLTWWTQAIRGGHGKGWAWHNEGAMGRRCEERGKGQTTGEPVHRQQDLSFIPDATVSQSKRLGKTGEGTTLLIEKRSWCLAKQQYQCRLHAKLLQSCSTLWKPMDYSLPGSSVHGILQARVLEWVAMPSSRGSSQPRDWTRVSFISCMVRWVLYH